MEKPGRDPLYAVGQRVIIRATADEPSYDQRGAVWRLEHSLVDGCWHYGVEEDGAVWISVYGVPMPVITWCDGWQLSREEER